MDRTIEDFALFPLSIVAVPGETVPLHVFERRYRTMIEGCLEGSPRSEFGILWLSDEELKPIGCACEIERVLERMDDGRMNILARGTRPFRLLRRLDDLPYPAGVIEYLQDDEEEPDEEAALTARELYRQLVAAATDRELSEDELSDICSYDIAATVEFELDAKQDLLELRSENARMRLLALLLGAAIERMDLVERAQARARSNGKVRFG